MPTFIWIVLAFVVGVLFGRMLRPSGDATDRSVGATPKAKPVLAVGDPNGAYHLTLVDRGDNLINTIKAVREVTRLGLKDSKDLVEAAPTALIRVASAGQADAILRGFHGIATVRVDGPDESTQPTHDGSAPIRNLNAQ